MSVDSETANESRAPAAPVLDMSWYEQMISEGIAEADRRQATIDHLTARRLAIWLAAQPQRRDFSKSLKQFIKTGALSRELMLQLRLRARSKDHPHRDQAGRLVQYSIARSRRRELGPMQGFSDACDQIDRADEVLAGLRDEVRQGNGRPRQARPAASVSVVARVTRNSRTVNLTLDPVTANLVMYAVTAQAAEREAHAREVDQLSRSLPEGSYGRKNRETIASREMHAAERLRAIERSYQTAIDDAAAIPYDPAPSIHAAGQFADHEIEME